LGTTIGYLVVFPVALPLMMQICAAFLPFFAMYLFIFLVLLFFLCDIFGHFNIVPHTNYKFFDSSQLYPFIFALILLCLRIDFLFGTGKDHLGVLVDIIWTWVIEPAADALTRLWYRVRGLDKGDSNTPLGYQAAVFEQDVEMRLTAMNEYGSEEESNLESHKWSKKVQET
jgi:hypothetical protein